MSFYSRLRNSDMYRNRAKHTISWIQFVIVLIFVFFGDFLALVTLKYRILEYLQLRLVIEHFCVYLYHPSRLKFLGLMDGDGGFIGYLMDIKLGIRKVVSVCSIDFSSLKFLVKNFEHFERFQKGGLNLRRVSGLLKTLQLFQSQHKSLIFDSFE